MALLFYYILGSVVYIATLPYLIFLSFKKKYKYSIPARFFLINNPSFKKSGIWFHACSLGEVNSLKPIFSALEDKQINLSVITNTGYEAAKSIDNIDIRYLPFEIFLPFWIRKNDVLVVTEAELWPLLFICAKIKGAKTLLINARISDRSYKGYKRFVWFYNWLFSYVDIVMAQSVIDKNRLKEFGAKNVHVNGNIKTFAIPKITKYYDKPSRTLWTMASSHNDEEALLLDSLNLDFTKEMLMVVPRHPERFYEVAELLQNYTKKNGLRLASIKDEDAWEADVVLCDVMGELVNIFAVTDVALLCGSFVKNIGGHNPLEPAYFNTKLITGPYTFNQNALFPLVKHVQVCEAKALQNLNINAIKPSQIEQCGDMQTLLKEIKI